MPSAVKPFSKGYRIQDVFLRNDFSNKPLSLAVTNKQKTVIAIRNHNKSGIRSYVNEQDQ